MLISKKYDSSTTSVLILQIVERGYGAYNHSFSEFEVNLGVSN